VPNSKEISWIPVNFALNHPRCLAPYNSSLYFFAYFRGLMVKSSILIICVFSLTLENLIFYVTKVLVIFVHTSLMITLLVRISLYNELLIFLYASDLKFSLSCFNFLRAYMSMQNYLRSNIYFQLVP